MEKHFEVRAYRPHASSFAVVVQDITDRLRDEQALAERERLLSAILETTQEGFFIAEADGRFSAVNSSYCKMLGYTRDEFLAMAISDQTEGATPEAMAKRQERVRLEGHDRFETKHRRKDGSLFDAEISTSFLNEDGGKYIAFCRDITERKKTLRLIHEQGERLELALSGTGTCLWDWDMKSGAMILDPNWSRLLGYPLSDLHDVNKARWKEICHPEDLAASEKTLERYLAGELPRYECELRVKRYDGLWLWVRNQGEIVDRDAEGRPQRMIGLMFDIETQKENERKLRSALGDKEALLSELYHRTRNSMQLINAMLELKKQEIGDHQVFAAFDDIQNKILAMALVQQKLYEANCLVSIDLGSYVSDLLELYRSEHSGIPTSIDFVAEGGGVDVSADIAIPCGLIISELVGIPWSTPSPSERGERFPWPSTRTQGEPSISRNGTTASDCPRATIQGCRAAWG